MSSILIEGILFVNLSDINFLILFRNTSLGDWRHVARRTLPTSYQDLAYAL
jgi:hypothetical protein